MNSELGIIYPHWPGMTLGSARIWTDLQGGGMSEKPLVEPAAIVTQRVGDGWMDGGQKKLDSTGFEGLVVGRHSYVCDSPL